MSRQLGKIPTDLWRNGPLTYPLLSTIDFFGIILGSDICKRSYWGNSSILSTRVPNPWRTIGSRPLDGPLTDPRFSIVDFFGMILGSDVWKRYCSGNSSIPSRRSRTFDGPLKDPRRSTIDFFGIILSSDVWKRSYWGNSSIPSRKVPDSCRTLDFLQLISSG